jgi:hypothetical protein
MDAPQRVWIADPRTTCSMRYTSPAELRPPRATEGVDIEHGGSRPWGPTASTIRCLCPTPLAQALCRLSDDTLKLGLGLLGIPSLEWMRAMGIGIKRAASWPSGWNPV